MKLCFLFDCKNFDLFASFFRRFSLYGACALNAIDDLLIGEYQSELKSFGDISAYYILSETCRRKNICTPKSSRGRSVSVSRMCEKNIHIHTRIERTIHSIVCLFVFIRMTVAVTTRHTQTHTHNVWPMRDKSTHSSYDSCLCVTMLLFTSICDVCYTCTTMRRALDAPSVAIIIRSNTIKMWFAN